MAGGRISAAIADHVQRALVATRQDLAGHHVNLAMAIQEAFFGLTGTELRIYGGPVLQALIDHPDTDPGARALLDFIAQGHGQFATMLGNQVLGSAVGTGLGAFLSNLLQPVTGRLIATNPHLPMSVADAARAYVTGLGDADTVSFDALQQGIDAHRFEILGELSRLRPSADVILDWLNRGVIDADKSIGWLRQLGYHDDAIIAMREARFTEVSPDRLADAVTFGSITQAQAAIKAARSGTRAEDFDLLVRTNGTPPSITDLTFALRRGVIDRATYERGLMQSPLRNEWIPLMERIVLQPMSVADAIEAAVKGYLDEDQARAIAIQNGLVPEQYQPLRDSAGEPPGVQEMVSMYRRGILTRDQLVKGIRSSRLKNEYIEATIAAAETLPPERSIVSLVSKGSLTEDRGKDLLLKRGYAPDIADALLAEAHATKTTKQRELTASQVALLYEDRAITQDAATAMLTNLGYDAETAGWELAIADLNRLRKFNEAAISRVHAAYLAGKIDVPTASTTLDGLRIAPEQRDDLLTLWSLEKTVTRKALTLTQLEQAAKKGIIDAGTFMDRVAGLGYSDDDVLIIAQLTGLAPTQQGGQGG